MKPRLAWAIAVFAGAAALLLVRIGSVGIWDPWELETADAARRLAAGTEPQDQDQIGLSVWLVSQGFRFFGVHEWSGRLPIALCGMLAVLVAFLLAGRDRGARAGLYAAVITGSTTLFLFNSRLMMGQAPAFAAQAGVALGAAGALFQNDESSAGKWRSTLGWIAVLVVSTVLAVQSRGALLCALPPLLAATAVALFSGYPARFRQDPPRALAACTLSILTVGLLALVARDILGDRAEYSPWLGGRAGAGQPETFETTLEAVFHSFAPWSALLPLALGRMALPPTNAGERHCAFRAMLLLWIAGGYGAQTLYLARYGAEAVFLPVVALAVAVALLMRDVEQSDRGYPAYAIVSLFFAALVIRDYALYPDGPLAGMALGGLEVPEALNLKREWATLIGLVAVIAALGFGVRPGGGRPDLGAPYRLIKEQWRRGPSFKFWLIFLALLLVATTVLGVLAFAAPQKIGMSTLATRWARRLAFLPLTAPIAIALAQLGLYAYGKLRGYRLLPVMLAGAIFALAAGQGYLPALAAHLSPREIYETYNIYADERDELAEYGVGVRAAAYYANGKVREIESHSELVAFLVKPGKRWAALPADDLPAVNRLYRKRTGEHLFVADARSARIVLATSRKIKGLKNQSFLAESVLKQPPSIQHPVRALLDDKIEFLGYDLDLPYGRYAGAGDSFTITWYFRVLKAIAGNYKMFVHIDGRGLRINGDHDPLDGKYPLRLWDKGDVVVDRQTLKVPSHFRGGGYTIYMGFFSGNTRMKVNEGPADNENRVNVGVLTVR